MAGDFGNVGSRPEVEGWLAATGFEVARRHRSGPMLFFDARRVEGPG
jgi:carotenoid cleavage dioxygenase-like enzyme